MMSKNSAAPISRADNFSKFNTGLALVAAITSVAGGAVLCGVGSLNTAFAIGAAAGTLLLALVIRPSMEAALLFWFVTAPLAESIVHLPSDDPVLTYDRAFFGFIGLIALSHRVKARLATSTANVEAPRRADGEFGVPEAPRSRERKLSRLALHFESSWTLLCLIALFSACFRSAGLGYGLRVAVDSFCLPLIAFYAARSCVNLRGRGSFLLAGAAALAFFLFATGAYELIARVDLLPFEGSNLFRESEIRVNGPFNSDSSYAVISLQLALFLRAAPRILGVRLDRSARLVWIGALGSAVAASLLPLYRTVGVALVVSWALVEWQLAKDAGRLASRAGLFRLPISRRRLAAVTLLFVAVAGAALLYESGAEGRIVSARNIYSRLATWSAAARISLDQPVFGVGLTNYTEQFNRKYSRADQWEGAIGNARPAAYPHSNALWIAAELGLPAFAIYVFANVALFWMGVVMLRAAKGRQRVMASCFLGLLAAYSIPGLTLTSGAYSDLNLYFFLFLAILANPRHLSRESGERL